MNLALSIFTIEKTSILMGLRGLQLGTQTESQLGGIMSNIGNEYRRRGVIQSFRFHPLRDPEWGRIFRFTVADGGFGGEHLMDFKSDENLSSNRIEIRVVRLSPEIRIPEQQLGQERDRAEEPGMARAIEVLTRLERHTHIRASEGPLAAGVDRNIYEASRVGIQLALNTLQDHAVPESGRDRPLGSCTRRLRTLSDLIRRSFRHPDRQTEPGPEPLMIRMDSMAAARIQEQIHTLGPQRQLLTLEEAAAVGEVREAAPTPGQTYTRSRPLLNPLTILQMSLDDLVPLGRLGAIRVPDPFDRSIWMRRLTHPDLGGRIPMAERMHRLTQALRGRRYTEIEARVIAYVTRMNGPEITELRRCTTTNSSGLELNLVRSWGAISATGIPAPGTENASIPPRRSAGEQRVDALTNAMRTGGITMQDASTAIREFVGAFPNVVRSAGDGLQGLRQAARAQRELDRAVEGNLSRQDHARTAADYVTISTLGNGSDFGTLEPRRTNRRETMPGPRIPTITVDSNFIDNCFDVSVVTAEGERLHGQISRELWQERRWYLEPTDAVGMNQRAREIIEFLESIQEDEDDDDQETQTNTQAPISPGMSHVNYGALERRLMMDLPTANQTQPMTPEHAQIEGIIIDDWPFEMEAEYEIKAPQRRIMTTLPKEETAKKEAKKPVKKSKKKPEPDLIDPAIEDDTVEFDPYDFLGIQNED